MEVRVPVPLELRPFLRWWTLQSNVASGRPFQDLRPTRTLTTDASLTGWGATLGTWMTSGQWTPQEMRLHINILETEAVIRAISEWADRLRGHAVVVRTDNTTAMAYINREGGTRSAVLTDRIWCLLSLCDRLGIALRAAHIAGSSNLVADALSRGMGDHEISLSQSWADRLFRMFGTPAVDLFASRRNHRLPRFCTRYPEPGAWATDAFSVRWDGLYVYAFPPLGLVQRVLTVLSRSTATMLLIAPLWPNQPWFTLLLRLSTGRSFQLPASQTLLEGPQELPANLHLTAWLLSGNASRQQI